MPVALYMDVHVQQAISDQLRRRGVDVLTAIEDGYRQAADDKILERAHLLGRVIFSQDEDFLVLAAAWQSQDRPFSGVLFGHQLGGTIGQYVHDLELIAKASDLPDWLNIVEYLPYKS